MKVLSTFLLSFIIPVAIAYENGDVILTNSNLSNLNNHDAIQFELRTNGAGLVHTKVLTATPPSNQHVLTKWDFSDQTTYFDVYIRNLSKGQLDYLPCGLEHINYQRDSIITIDGYRDGKIIGCKMLSAS